MLTLFVNDIIAQFACLNESFDILLQTFNWFKFAQTVSKFTLFEVVNVWIKLYNKNLILFDLAGDFKVYLNIANIK